MNQLNSLYRFYAFPQLELNETRWNIRWLSDSKLRQNINNIIWQKPQLTTEENLAWHFLEIYLDKSENAEPEMHLKAFLASFSVDIIRIFDRKLKRNYRNNDDTCSLLQDAFQTSFKYALIPKTFLRGFQIRERNEYSYYSLKKYIQERMYGLVRDELIKEKQVNSTSSRTNLGLAAKSSQKRVKDALEAQGITKEKIADYIGIWKTFQEIRKSNKSNAISFTEEQFKEITRRYNQLNYVQVDDKTIKIFLENIGKAIRDYQNPKVYSLDIRYNPEDITSLPLVEYFPDTSSVGSWDRLLREENQENLRTFLENQIQKLDMRDQSLLLLRHGFKLVQKQIAGEINKDTATVNRRYNTLLAVLIQQMREWRNQYWNMHGEDFNRDFTSEELKEIKFILIDFLNDLYFYKLFQIFQQTFYNLSIDSKNILDSYYRSYFNMTYCEYSNINNYSSNEVHLNDALLSEAYKLLQAGISQQIHKHYSLSLKSNGSAWLQFENIEFINRFMMYIENRNKKHIFDNT